MITFDEYPVGTPIETQYMTAGVVFDLDSEDQPPVIAGDAANPSSPSLSGVPIFQGPIKGRFVDASGDPRTVDTFTVEVGYVDDFGTTTVTAFGVSDDALEMVSVEAFGYVPVTIDANGIASFIVSDPEDPSGFGIDNLMIPGGSISNMRYVALGDSYSAGEGDPPFDKGTDQHGNRCHRSEAAWPRMLSGMKPALLPVVLIACSGAEASDITVTSHYGEPPQIQQLKALGTAPHIITITIGGNDVGFAHTLARCVILNCAGDGTLAERVRFVQDELPTLLADTLQAIKAAATDARLILVGYPSLVPSDYSLKRGCIWLARNENQGLAQLAMELDTIEREAAVRSRAEYVSALDALRGHELCTAQSWVNAVGVFRALRHYSGHPTEVGQHAIASVVDSYLRQS